MTLHHMQHIFKLLKSLKFERSIKHHETETLLFLIYEYDVLLKIRNSQNFYEWLNIMATKVFDINTLY